MGKSSCSSTEKISTTESPSRDFWVEDSASTGWTDEKHSLFLDSIESSFVDELYNSRYHSNDFCGCLLESKKRTYSCRSHENEFEPDQFKVMRRGCWESVRFERAKTQAESKDNCLPMLSSPWIQHFSRSPSAGKKVCGTAYGVLADNEFVNSSFQVASQKNSTKETKLKDHPCLPSIYSQDLSKTEVSDQNFVDDEVVVGEQASDNSCTNTQAYVHCITDKVVPCGEERGLLEIPDADYVGRTSEISAVHRKTNSEFSLFRDQG